jgi:hypothetical protein
MLRGRPLRRRSVLLSARRNTIGFRPVRSITREARKVSRTRGTASVGLSRVGSLCPLALAGTQWRAASRPDIF